MAFCGILHLLPILGTTLFGWLTYALQNVHNFVGRCLPVSLLVIILPPSSRDSIANRRRLLWLSKGGGRGDGAITPSNHERKGCSGGAWIPGIFVVGSGLVLDKLLTVGDVRTAIMPSHT